MLVLFDIDGTLTQTNALDATLFARAFAETFRIELPTLDWTAYRDVSDRGVAEEGALRALGRRARPDEIAAMRERFLTSLRRALGEHVGKLEVPGADAILRTLREEGRTVALATGCWDASARLKLAHAEIDIAGLTLAASDDEPDRARIMATAIEASGAVVGRDAIVYVGDGPWDAAVARRVGVGFVGIDVHRTGTLGRAGAFEILHDFEDGSVFLAALARAHQRMQSRSTA